MSSRRGDRRRVTIVGGGLAGLSAAEALAREHGDRLTVTLLEAKRAPGGRAGSFSDSATGESVDYCQHVAMGCCTNLLGLLHRCGLSDSLRRSDELVFLHPEFPPSRFAPLPSLPAPLHLSRVLASLNYLNSRQRRQIQRGVLQLFRTPSNDLRGVVAGDWLREAGQASDVIREFWGVIVVSALGEQIDAVSMSAVRKVFVDGFAAARGASDLLIPQVPLSKLYGVQLRQAVEDLGVQVRTGTTVERIRPCGDVAVVESKRGDSQETDHVIVAVPWHSVTNLVTSELLSDVPQFSMFPASPITGVHLWLDRQITDRPHAVLVGTVSQWLFRQPWTEDHASDSGHYYQVVISASREARSVSRDSLVQTVLEELKQVFPLAADARIQRYRIVTDPKSVFSVRPEVEASRPSARTALPWLHLAGDWIDTGWPSTMEGAVIGGRLAAASVAAEENLESIEVDPGLPRGWLARRLIRP